MDPETDSVIRTELGPDENLLWSGRPDASRLFTLMDVFLVPFSLLWGGFAIFWEITSLVISVRSGQGSVLLFPVFGAFFVVVGCYLIFGRFFAKRWTRQHTYYGLTDRRVLAIDTTFGRKVRSLSIKRLPGLEVSTGRGRLGTVTFGHWSGLSGMYANTGLDFLAWGWGERPLAFFDIPDAHAVYELVERLSG